MATDTAVDVVMPQMGVSVSEGTITRWLKQEGEHIEADEVLLEISTDKVDTEVPSPASGTLVADPRPGGRDGRGRDEARADRWRRRRARTRCRRARGSAALRAEPEPVAELRSSRSSAPPRRLPPSRAPAPAASANGKAFVSPVVARIASEHGVDPSQVPGTGQGGRVTKKDILAFVESGGAAAGPRRRLLPLRPHRQLRLRPQQPPRPRRRRPRRSRARRSSRSRPCAAASPSTCASSLDTARARHERDRGRLLAHRRGPRAAQEGVPGRVRRQPDVPRVHRAGDGRDAARLPVRQRRDARRLDRHAQLRQPRHRGRARGRQGADRPGHPQRRGPQPPRPRAGHRRHRRRRRATSSSCRTTFRAARSRSRTPAATARSTARRSSASRSRRSSARTRS